MDRLKTSRIGKKSSRHSKKPIASRYNRKNGEDRGFYKKQTDEKTTGCVIASSSDSDIDVAKL